MKQNGIIDYNKQIDGLRCFAVFGVLICHFIRFNNVYMGSIPFGYGVNLFFVISGYLITKILLVNKEKIQTKKTNFKNVIQSFYFRRTLRIFPIYYLTILYLIVINFQNTRSVWVWLITYTTNFYISFDHPYIGSFNHLWSLAVEEQFYLIWPFLILLIPQKHIFKYIIGIIIGSVVFKVGYYLILGPSTAINALTFSCADSLGLGALISYLTLYNKKILSKINNVKYIVLISFLSFYFFLVFSKHYPIISSVTSNFLFSICAFFAISKASEFKYTSITKWILENPIIIHLGKISYGIYLYHFFMPDLYNEIVEKFPNSFLLQSHMRTTFLFIATIIVAELSWFIIERPLLSLKSRYYIPIKTT